MANENAVQNKQDFMNDDSLDSFDLDELEATLQGQLEEELSDLAFLQEEHQKIGNPDALGETIMNVVWEQFINQIATTAGEDFIKENHGLRLDLRNEAHIQTPENFAEGKIAKHNHISKEQLEQNYNRYQNTPHKEFREQYVNPGMDNILKRAGALKKEGIDSVTDIYTGEQIPTQTKLDNGKNNPEAAQREHVKSSAELYGNASLQMANNNEELANIINNPENLQGYTTAERNNRKSDKTASEMDEQDKTKKWEKANERAEEYIKQKEKEGEDRLKKEGRKTQREEAFRISGKAFRAVVMQLLAELMKEIIAKLVKWLKSAAKKLETLLSALKEAISSFVGKLKTHLMNAADTALTTIASAIFGPVINTVKKVWTFLKQGWKSLMEAVAYIRNPENKGKPIGILLLEVGKIVTAGLTAAGAIVLGEVIEKALIAIPGVGAFFAFEIPLLGSLANLLGIFLGGVVAGIIGAIVINLLQKQIDKAKKSALTEETIKKGNEILNLQYQAQIVGEALLERDKDDVQSNISGRHQAASTIMRDAYENIMEDFVVDFSNVVNTPVIDEKDLAINQEIDKASSDLDALLSGWN